MAALALTLGLASGCTKDQGPESRLSIAVQPLHFPALSDVVYRLTVKRQDGQVVWTRDVGSARYGDGKGSLAFVGPCDASDDANPHTVELVVVDLLGPDGQPLGASRWANPAPPERPATLPATCVANGDTPVTFNLTLMRAAEQGFFDIAVSFEDLFCSAKLDCRGQDGEPLKLLFNPATQRRDSSIVLAMACTSGQTLANTPEPTWLHVTDVAILCDDAAPIYFDAGQTPGQHGPVSARFFEGAIYRGAESLPGYDKCFWNMAFGIDLAARPKGCRLVAAATASRATFEPTGHTPPNTIYPYVRWEVPLTDPAGNLTCSQHPLNGSDGAVQTGYTATTGAFFQHSWRCGADDVTSTRLACDGAFGDGTTSTVYPAPDGVSIAIGAQRSAVYRLPEGLDFGESPECCVNPCCSP